LNTPFLIIYKIASVYNIKNIKKCQVNYNKQSNASVIGSDNKN